VRIDTSVFALNFSALFAAINPTPASTLFIKLLLFIAFAKLLLFQKIPKTENEIIIERMTL